MNRNLIRKWELALILALCATMLSGVWAGGTQGKLASKMIRLHVIAESDSEEDQQIKLLVRDAVLEELTPILEEADGIGGAKRSIAENMDRISETAAELAGCPVTVTLGEEDYPTRDYDGFSLPAGRYTSLRVTLGEGEGKNWWCVVFPPLCLSAAEASFEETAGLTEDEVGIITEADDVYEIKFRILELWDSLRLWLTH